MKLIKGLISLFVLLFVLGGAVAGGGWLWFQHELSKPGPSTEQHLFLVEPGETLSGVAQRLEDEGIISDDRLFKLKAKLDGTELAIKTGEFELEPRASLSEVMETLIDGKSVFYKITLPEGRTTAQLLKMVEADPVLIGDMPEEEVAEGSLLPDTYLFHRGTSRADLIERMQKAQTDLLDELWPQRAEDLPIASKQEAVILASVVEKETGIVGERPQIAGLFITRLKRGMRLESDPTIIYGVSKGEPLYNKRGQRRTLYRSEIDRKTDWNTYQIDGLPKTPICNPGRDAIAAVLNPEETGHIFFVADGKGGHLFAKTLAEHNKNVAAYRRYERQEIQKERTGQ
ncbi:MAG: endolytic transglycosylase MltG [Alphaproteobacteria bacterium]|nr:endolytic transglycosylase MltG [Alphaproteobacteria bacterium]|tara:strand:- start:1405 stop:2433 length:1029 start_codon:yes stop_codon:yes gene_type:complete